jgi:hypothetical protein
MNIPLTTWRNISINFRQDPKSFLKYVLAFFIFLIVFLGFYKPFFLQRLNSEELSWAVIRISAFTLLLLPTSFVVVTSSFKKQVANWSISYELLWVTFHFIVIGLHNIYVFRQYEVLDDICITTIMFTTCLVGLIPSILDIYTRTVRENKPASKNERVIYVKSDGNYIHVYKLESGDIKREIHRTPLNNFQRHTPSLIQVHKSFLVNSNLIKDVNGNSNGGNLTLIEDLQIPYSRGFYNNVKALAS